MPAKYKKRADGRYSTHVAIGVKDDGKPLRRTIYAKTIRELEEKAAELRRQVGTGTVVNDGGITVGEWADLWITTYKSSVSYNTQRMYSLIVENYIKTTIGYMKLKDVKTIHLQRIINENQKKTGIVKKFRLTINQIFEQAMLNDMIVKNPAKGISLPKSQLIKEKRALTTEEVEKINSLPLDMKTKCFVMLLMYTGMRKGEALALTKKDINKSEDEIIVNKSVIFKVNQSEIKTATKTVAGMRKIPVLSVLKNMLYGYVDAIETEVLFATKEGKTLSDTAYRLMWSKFEKAMGTKEITAHIFRHNFATTLYNAGVDVKTAQEILGHKSIQVTMGIYTHLDKTKRHESIDKLDAHTSSSQNVVEHNGGLH